MTMKMTRYTFYRNFIDPYEYSWKNGNSRWDLLDLVRACYALRPEGINWAYDDDGMPSFRLEKLTKAMVLSMKMPMMRWRMCMQLSPWLN